MTTAQTTNVGGLHRPAWNPKIFGMAAIAIAVALVAAFLVTRPTAEPVDVRPAVNEYALSRALETQNTPSQILSEEAQPVFSQEEMATIELAKRGLIPSESVDWEMVELKRLANKGLIPEAAVR